MKNYYSTLILAAVIVAAGCQSTPQNSNPAKVGDITVNFQDQDSFTDARERSAGPTSQYYLDELSKYLKETAAMQLKAGEKLTVTFTDIDLAGDIPPGRTDDVRIVKDIYIPRMVLHFELKDAAGAVIKEGERRLSDLNFQMNARPLINQNEPLRYDKSLLENWVKKEFSQ